MLERESEGAGWSVTLRPQGAARLFVVAFLGFWLCGWLAGEVFVGYTLLAGVLDLLAPGHDIPGLRHMSGKLPANAWPILAFLGVWFTFWTFGGATAIWQVLRVTIGRDVIAWDHEGLRVRERAGPFARTRALAWYAASDLHVREHGGLVAYGPRGVWPVTGYGSAEDRRTLHDWLEHAWRDARGAEHEAEFVVREAPRGWVAGVAEDGRDQLESDRRGARPAAFVLGALALAGLWFAAVVAVRGSGAGPLVAAGIAALLGLALAALASWLATGRDVLRPGDHRLVRERHWLGRTWRRELNGASLRLEQGHDSDGDERWTLVAQGDEGRFTVASELHAPGVARAVGRWLAARMGVALESPGTGGRGDRRRSA